METKRAATTQAGRRHQECSSGLAVLRLHISHHIDGARTSPATIWSGWLSMATFTIIGYRGRESYF